MGEGDLRSIAAKCRRGLENLMAAAISRGCPVQDTLPLRDLHQVQERYDQWAGNLGVLQPSTSPLSLDHRLRDNPMVKKMIFDILRDLDLSLQSAAEIAAGKRANRGGGAPTPDPEIDVTEFDISSSESDSSAIASSSNAPPLSSPTSEIQELVSAVIDRYPKLERRHPVLAERLGEANARRRQYFKYRNDHNERLSTVHSEKAIVDSSLPQAGPRSNNSRTAKSVLTGHTVPSVLAATEATAFVPEPGALTEMQGLPSPEPAMSIISYATSIGEPENDGLQFPPIPGEAREGSPFLCPYCLTVVQLKRGNLDSQWRKHVINDLEPYICTFPTCGLETYRSENAWFEHELLTHRSHYNCPQCSQSFESSDRLSQHLGRHEVSTITGRQLPILIEQAKRPAEWIKADDCPFCDDPWAQLASESTPTEEGIAVVTPDQFKKHVGHHLRQTALFSLPRLSIDLEAGSKAVRENLDQDHMSKGLLSYSSLSLADPADDDPRRVVFVPLSGSPVKESDSPSSIKSPAIPASSTNANQQGFQRILSMLGGPGGSHNSILDNENAQPNHSPSLAEIEQAHGQTLFPIGEQIQRQEHLGMLDATKNANVSVTNLRAIRYLVPLQFFLKDTSDFMGDLIRKAADLEDDLVSEDLLLKLITVSMHQQVICCNNNSRMRLGGLWESQKNLIRRITQITTQLLPDGEGVALRFLNQEDINDSTKLRPKDIEEIMEPIRTPRGPARIDTSLWSKVLQPLVHDKIETKSLERPLLITIIIDNCANMEYESWLINTILECGEKLENAGYPRESVKFMIGQIGTDEGATELLAFLRNNRGIAPVAFITPDILDKKFEELGSNTRQLDRWLIETLFSPFNA